MTRETNLIYHRMQLQQLLKEHPDWTNKQLAKATGFSIAWVRKWRPICSQETTQLKDFTSKSRAPKRIPNKTSQEAIKYVIDLREELSRKYNRPAGPDLIAHELKERQATTKIRLPRSSKTVWRILSANGLIAKKSKRVTEPIDLPAPMEEWEIDFGEVWIENEGVFEMFLAVDRGTSRVVFLDGMLNGYNAQAALDVLLQLFIINGTPKRLRFDRDPRFVASWTVDSYPSPMIRFLRCLGIEPIVCPPRRPDLKPFVERTIGTLKREWLERFSEKTMIEINENLDKFLLYYNNERSHFGRACNGKTPNQAFPNLPSLPHLPEDVDPDRWVKAYNGRVFRRTVNSNGIIQVDKHHYYIGKEWSKRPVLVRLDAESKSFHILQDGKEIKRLPMKGLYNELMPLSSYFNVVQEEARTIAYYRQMHWKKIGEVA